MYKVDNVTAVIHVALKTPINNLCKDDISSGSEIDQYVRL